MKQNALYILFLLSFSCLQAQPFVDIAGLQYMKNKPDRLLNENKDDVKAEWLCGHITYPMQLRDSSVIVITAGYERWNLDFKLGETAFQTAFLPVTWLKPLSASWKISFTAIQRFNNEVCDDISSRNLQFGGAVIATHQVSEKLKLKGGLYYNREFFGNYFLPLAGIEWKAAESLTLFGLLPNNLFLDLRVNRLFHTGILYKGITTSFRLGKEDFYGYYRMQEGQVTAFADLYITKNLVFNLQAGHTVLRENGYGFLNEDYIIQDLKDGYILKAGIFYRIWVD